MGMHTQARRRYTKSNPLHHWDHTRLPLHGSLMAMFPLAHASSFRLLVLRTRGWRLRAPQDWPDPGHGHGEMLRSGQRIENKRTFSYHETFCTNTLELDGFGGVQMPPGTLRLTIHTCSGPGSTTSNVMHVLLRSPASQVVR